MKQSNVLVVGQQLLSSGRCKIIVRTPDADELVFFVQAEDIEKYPLQATLENIDFRFPARPQLVYIRRS